MSDAPFYIYIIGLIVALPVFFLLATFLVMFVRSILTWVMNDEVPINPPLKTTK